MLVITVFWRPRLEDYNEHEASISYMGWRRPGVIPYLKIKQENWTGKALRRNTFISASVATAMWSRWRRWAE